MDINQYRELICKINPLEESKFRYNIQTLKNLNVELKAHLSQFENNFIKRVDVINSFRKYYEGIFDWEIPFAITMIWGFADTGYGSYRTNKFYATESNRNIIEYSFKLAEDNKIESAYKALQTINGLNISYISKLLYFATRAKELRYYSLIYDIRVAKSLVKLTCPPEIYEILDIKPSNKFYHYKRYNDLMHKIADENDVSAESLEMFLFMQNF